MSFSSNPVAGPIRCPAAIEFLLHCHVQPFRPFERLEAPFYVELVPQWEAAGIIVPHPPIRGTYPPGSLWRLTPLGVAWVRALEAVPLPIPCFKDAAGNLLPER